MKQRLVIIGAGPKALAISAKLSVLKNLGFNVPQVEIVEKNQVASNWVASGGYTTGELPLGTSPEKDIAFPYQSNITGNEIDKIIDAQMTKFSFQNFMIESGQYSKWVDSSRPAPSHKQWAEYLSFVAKKIPGLKIRYGCVVKISGDKGNYSLALSSGENVNASSIVVTGPGVEKKAEKLVAGKRVIHSQQINQVNTIERSSKIAIVGAGESAAAATQALLGKGHNIDIYTSSGVIYTRGENYFENRVFTQVANLDWKNLPLDKRKEFISRTDRGVFSREVSEKLNFQSGLEVKAGRVRGIIDQGKSVRLEFETLSGEQSSETYEYVISAMGFDPLGFVNKLFNNTFEGLNLSQDIDENLRIKGTEIYVPMLAGLAQGPGFANLSSLGSVADRIISAFVQTKRASADVELLREKVI